MNCFEFKNWIREVNAQDPAVGQEAKLHIATCPRCEKLYTLDQVMEQRLSETISEIDPPDELYVRIKRDLPFKSNRRKKPAIRWRMVAPALAAAVAILLVFMIYPGRPIRDIEHIGSLALTNHLEDGRNMAFNAGDVNDVAAWFVKRIGFAAAPPEQLEPGLIFQGARPCKLGPNDAAYLYYKKNGKKCSVFIIDSDGLKFKLKRNTNYFVDKKNHDIRVWTEDGLVYAMVN